MSGRSVMVTVPADHEGLAQAAEAIRSGEVVAYPTETVYGLGVDPFNEVALAKLFELKGRPDTKPILLIVESVRQLDRVALEVSEAARRYMETFWPGPLSLLFPRRPELPLTLTAGGEKVCVRCPGLETARRLCALAGGPITSTSANLSGDPPIIDSADFCLAGVAVLVDGGKLEPSAPSTVLDPDTGRVLRPGAISESAIVALRREVEQGLRD